MRTIIAGSREVTKDQFDQAIVSLRWTPSLVVSGGARGVDNFGERWAVEHLIPVKIFPAVWKRPDGSVDKGAGFKRNVEMSKNADALFAVWDGQSRGTKHMIDTATKAGLVVQVALTGDSEGSSPVV